MKGLMLLFICLNLFFAGSNYIMGVDWTWIMFNFMCALLCYVGYINAYANK